MRLSQVNSFLRILFLLGIPVASNGQTYTFVKVADTSGPFSTFATDPSINDSGTVAFHALDQARKSGIYTWKNGTVTTVSSHPVASFAEYDFAPRITRDGAVLYFYGSLSDSSLRITKDGKTTVIADASVQFASSLGDFLSVNNAGRAAFAAILKTSDIGVFTGVGGAAETVALRADLLGNQPQGLSINDAGDVGVVTVSNAFLFSGGRRKILGDSSSGQAVYSGISLNNSGQVAYTATSLINGRQSLFLQTGDKNENLLPPDPTSFLGFIQLGHPTINDAGLLAFAGSTVTVTGVSTGLFVWDHGTVRKVILANEPLFGGIVDQVAQLGPKLSDRYLNNSGQIVFTYRLRDGKMGVAVATPELGPPALTSGSVLNGATYLEGIVPGSWAIVKGTNLSPTTRSWQGSDFAAGTVLPTSLDGVEVRVNNTPAAVSFISPGQINFQVPAGVSGTANIQVIRKGIASNIITGLAVNSAPGLFGYSLGGKTFPAAVYADSGLIVGDPALAGAAVRKAKPGDRISLFGTGLAPSPAGTTNVAVTPLAGVTATLGSASVLVEFAGLVGVGLHQINMVVPDVPDGERTIVIRYAGKESQTGLVIPVSR